MPARKGQVLIVATILIVDDRPANREFMVALLGYAHHRLLQASDGAEALALARAERPDLVIADILMPTMDGYELVRQLRADPRILQTRVIFWTAHYHEQEAKALARDCGVSAVITKPSEPEEVLKAVEAALRLAPVPAPPQTSTDEFDREHLRLLTDKLSQKADDLKVTNERLSALIDLNLQLASELDLQRLIQRFGRAVRLIVGARYSITAILDADGEQFKSLFTSGMDAETAARLGSQDPRSAALNAPLREGATIRLRNPSGDPLALGFSSSHPPIHAFLGAPIASPTRLYGYVGLIDRIGRDEFSEEDERLTAILAAQVGRIYQNGSLYSDVLSHAADLEREISARKQTEEALAERVRQGALIGEVDAALIQSDSQAEMLGAMRKSFGPSFRRGACPPLDIQ
jgi:two-component system cell cycle sensor histidine kinase/response regulator CckA